MEVFGIYLAIAFSYAVFRPEKAGAWLGKLLRAAGLVKY